MKWCRYFLSFFLFLTVALSISCEPQGGIDISGPETREELSDQRGGLGPPVTGEFRGGEPEDEDINLEPRPPSEDGPAPGIQRQEIPAQETPALIDTGVEKYFDSVLVVPSAPPVVVYQKGGNLYYATLSDNRWGKTLIAAPKEVSGKKVFPSFHPSLTFGGGHIKVAYNLEGEIKIFYRTGAGIWPSIDTENLPPVSEGGYLDLISESGPSHDHLAYRIDGSLELEYMRIATSSIISSEIIRLDRGGGAVALTFGPRKRLYLFQQEASNLKFTSLPARVGGWTSVYGATVTSNDPFDLIGTTGAFHLVYSGTGQILRYIVFNDRGMISAADTAIIANGTNPSLALHEGNPFVTYYREESLWLAKRTSSGWQVPTNIDGGSGKDVGEKSILKIDSQGTAHIVYYDNINKALRYYSQANP